MDITFVERVECSIRIYFHEYIQNVVDNIQGVLYNDNSRVLSVK